MQQQLRVQIVRKLIQTNIFVGLASLIFFLNLLSFGSLPLCRSEIPEGAHGCGQEDCPGNAAAKILEILQSCDKKTIHSQHEVPSIRACVNCGQV